jgi:leucyl aminopeptidase
MTEIVGGPQLEAGSGDLLAVPVFAERNWGPGAEAAVAALGDGIDAYLEARDFTGKPGQLVAVPGGDLPYGSVVFVGLGDEADAEALRRAAGTVGRFASPYRVAATTLHLVDVEGAVEAVSLGFSLGAYQFDKYRSEPKARVNERLVLLGLGDDAGDGIERGRIVADGVILARDLINEPAGGKPPEVLAGIAAGLSDDIEVEIIEEDEARDRGFGGLLGVASGATNRPRMVILRYEPEGSEASLALVGKGIVFDSGGLSIKSAGAMETMKTDMSGAAAVYGAMQAIARLGLPIRVFGVTPLTENMTGGAAQRPGDVLKTYNGKTIEVLNTDAEGRLVLSDALALAAEQEPDLIVDVATLTGASQVALGMKIGAVMGNDDEAVEQVVAAGKFAGEKLWRLPLEAEYRPLIDSSIADMKNTGSRHGGAITAALLLEEFVDDRPWVHLDIAGPARADKDEHYVTKGGTGFAVRTLVEVAKERSAGD